MFNRMLSDGSRRRAFVALAVAFAALAGSVAVAPWSAAAPRTCKRNCTTADTVAPSVSIGSPGAGASVSGSIAVSGSASDDRSLMRVELAIDGGASQTASGTTAWSVAMDTRAWMNGSHTISATAVDGAGNRRTTTVTVSSANTTTTPPPPPPSGDLVNDTVVQDSKATNKLTLFGRGNIATSGSRQVFVYREDWTVPNRVVAHVTDASTGAVSLVDLPSTAGAWTNAALVLTPDGDLWVLSGDAPVILRQYRFSGSPLPTSASLVSSRTFGDSDSRMGAITQLASGALVVVWHQQGQTGSEGHGLAYRRADGSWQEQFRFWAFTRASRDSLAQHPADGSVWLFNSADAWGSIGAAHFTEVAGGLRFDWADDMFIGSDEGQFDADPEFADIVALPDVATGELVLAYQSARRQAFAVGVIGSYPAIARLRADGQRSFTHLPVWVERSLPMALSVRPGEVWLTYRAVNSADLSIDNLEVRVLRNGAWSDAQRLGKGVTPIGATAGASFAFGAASGPLHAARAS